ncbi:MAG: IscS subfamily cysteine desulfurase [Endozoicomonadaceae bacterium]|nr:IscS subfamily cysteine desulfurase [Endozoicomonadaceae bacterium]MCY4329671.1 IscS subfamily cysteine desulfurase [Endozoicomonadaceae bacterium]
MRAPIYLDYAATTPVDKRVAEKMTRFLGVDGIYGNPASRSHIFGWRAEEAVEEARDEVAKLLNADPREIVWTSGATEADNLAIKGVARFYKDKGKHIITSKIEHKAVLDSCRQLEREGFEITYLSPDSEGIISPTQVEEALRDDTILVSLMHVNNEIGTVTDIEGIGEITRKNKKIFHVDAAQSAGKLPIDVQKIKADLISVCAHKIYGPKGVGALYVRRKPRVRIEAQIHGGGHERGMRSGTLPTHQLVGMGEAFRLAREEMQQDTQRVVSLRDRFWNKFKHLEEVYLNGSLKQHVAGILNISFNFVEGESLMMALKDLALSSGSACTSASLEPSYVLRALGRDDELAHSSLRFSFGRFTTEEEIDYAAAQVCKAVDKLRELSPLWDMHQDGIDLKSVKWAAH